MAVRKPEPVAEAELPIEQADATEAEASTEPGPVRRHYRALQTFEVEVGENRLLFHKGRRFSTDSIPFDARLMEELAE